MEQDCHAVVFISPDPLHVPPPSLPCLLPPPLPLSRGCGESSMRGNERKKRLICSLLGQLCSLAVPPFFDPLSPILGTSAILPLCVVSRCSSAVDFFFIVLFLSCVQGHRRTLWVSSWPEFSFISKINCFSIKPPSNNRSSCTVCCWSKLRPLLNWFCRSCWNIWFSRSEGFNKTEFCDHDSWTLSP